MPTKADKNKATSLERPITTGSLAWCPPPERWASNYIPFRPGADLDDCSFTVSTDRLVISVKPVIDIHLLETFQAHGFITIKDSALNGSQGYIRRRDLNHNSFPESAIRVLYRRRQDQPFLPNVMLHLFQPTRELCEVVAAIISIAHGKAMLSQVEISFDFNSENIIGIRQFLMRHLFLKRQSSKYPAFTFNTTYYTTNIRKASKGTRQYTKNINGLSHERLELVLNRTALSRTSLEWPSLDFSGLDLQQYFGFKTLNLESLSDYLNSFALKLSELNPTQQICSPGLTYDPMWRMGFAPYAPLMVLVQRFKQFGIKRPAKFLIDEPDATDSFFKPLHGRDFLQRPKEPIRFRWPITRAGP